MCVCVCYLAYLIAFEQPYTNTFLGSSDIPVTSEVSAVQAVLLRGVREVN